MPAPSPSRRHLLAAAAASAGAIALVALPRAIRAEDAPPPAAPQPIAGDLLAPTTAAFPKLESDEVSAVVGASHFDFDRVKELVERRPALAVATWDLGFGDFEAAIGAASHVGRRDIAEFLMRHGARPDLFTFAMLGNVDALRAILSADPAAASIPGPHGIPLLRHAEAGREFEGLSSAQTASLDATLEYLRTVEGASGPKDILDLPDDEKARYVGRYDFGAGEAQYATVSMNRRGVLSLGIAKPTGQALEAIEPGVFRFAGARKARVEFTKADGAEGKAVGLSIFNPDLVLKAKRVE